MAQVDWVCPWAEMNFTQMQCPALTWKSWFCTEGIRLQNPLSKKSLKGGRAATTSGLLPFCVPLEVPWFCTNTISQGVFRAVVNYKPNLKEEVKAVAPRQSTKLHLCKRNAK